MSASIGPSLFPDAQSPLPQFSTLFITGPYHPSAPIHLALSSKNATPESRTIILAPSRSALKGNLQQFNDAWLASRSGHGKMTELTLNDTIFYPPTPAHLCMLLSVICAGPDDTAIGQTLPVFGSLHGQVPTLLVLVEPSLYFTPSDTSGVLVNPSNANLTSYLNLVNRVLACISTLRKSSASKPARFVLFDAQLRDTKLPISSEHPPTHHEESGHKSHHQIPRQIPVLPLLERYFEWIGIFEEDSSCIPSSQGEELLEDEGSRKQLRLYHPARESDADVAAQSKECSWQELRSSSLNSKVEETHFRWPVD